MNTTKDPVRHSTANVRTTFRPLHNCNTPVYGVLRSESSVTSRSLSHGGRLVHPGCSKGPNHQSSILPHPPRQRPLPAEQLYPSVKVYAQPEMSQLTQDTTLFSGDSPAELALCSGPPAHQNSSQSQSTFASSCVRGGNSSFASRPMTTRSLRQPCQMFVSPFLAPPPLSRLATNCVAQGPSDAIFRKKSPGVVGGSSVTEGLCAPSALPPSPSAIKRGSAAFEKSLQEFHANKERTLAQQQEHDLQSTASGPVGSVYSEKHHHEFKQAMLAELSSVLESKMQKNLDEAMERLKSAMEASGKERTEATQDHLPSQVQDQINQKMLDLDAVWKDQLSVKLADLEARVEITRKELPNQVHGQMINKFLDLDADLEDRISTKFADLDTRMNALKLSSQEQVHELMQEHTDEFLVMADIAKGSLQDEKDRCGKEVAQGIESIRTETKTQMGLLQDAVKCHLAALQEVAGPVLEACQRICRDAVTAPAKLVVGAIHALTDKDIGSKSSTSRRRTISPVPSKGKRRASPSIGRVKVQGKRSKASQLDHMQQGAQSSIEQDSSWSSVGTRHSKVSRLTPGYAPLDIRLSQNPSTNPKKTPPAKIGQGLFDTDSKKDDQFVLSQGTLSSISCTQTAKTCELLLVKKKMKLTKVRRNKGLTPVVTPLGPNQSSSFKAKKKKDLVSQGPMEETPSQGPNALDPLLGSNASASACDIEYDSPLPHQNYENAPVHEIRTTVDDDVCPSPLTAASFIRGTNSALRRGKTARTTGPSMTSTTKSTIKGGTKMKGAAEKVKVTRRSRSRHKMTYSKRPLLVKDIIHNNDMDFMSDS